MHDGDVLRITRHTDSRMDLAVSLYRVGGVPIDEAERPARPQAESRVRQRAMRAFQVR